MLEQTMDASQQEVVLGKFCYDQAVQLWSPQALPTDEFGSNCFKMVNAKTMVGDVEVDATISEQKDDVTQISFNYELKIDHLKNRFPGAQYFVRTGLETSSKVVETSICVCIDGQQIGRILLDSSETGILEHETKFDSIPPESGTI